MGRKLIFTMALGTVLAGLYGGRVIANLPHTKDTGAGAFDAMQTFSASDLKRIGVLANSNQVIFRQEGGGFVPVCRCGPKLSVREMPQRIIDALIAVEDRRFFNHGGIDFQALMRAMYKNVTAGRFREGGSTITQQLIKNTVLSARADVERKASEALIAVKLERILTKREIVTAYLNQVEFFYTKGRPILGIEQAARHYFGKSASELGVLETAMLVGMLKNPKRYNPELNPAIARERALTALRLMLEAGVITRKEMKLALKDRPKRGSKKMIWPETRYFVQWVAADFAREHPHVPVDGELRIAITLEVRTQDHAERAFRGALEDWPSIDAAFVTMAKDGRVVAMAGGRDFGARPLNQAVAARRQPASAFKPFVYLAALESGKKMTAKMSDAFAQSLNPYAVQLADLAGLENVAQTAKRLGIVSPLRRDRSLALGASETSLLELTTAYAAFASGGFKAKPYGYYGALSHGSELVWRTRDPPRRVVKKEQMKAMHRLFRYAVEHGTGAAAAVVPCAAGKTGTNQDNRDAWFVGYTEKQVTGVWLGNADNSPLPGLSGRDAARVWASVTKTYGKSCG
jgi:penicillin-binding protein 1A